MKVRVQKEWYEREKVEKDKECVYLFGDNYAQYNKNYAPKVTQAVIRGLPNAIGIPTKNDSRTGEWSYLRDTQYNQFKQSTLGAIEKAIDSRKTIVIPADGIGTGAAKLSRWAPKCNSFLSGVLNTLYLTRKRENGSSEAS